MYTRGQTPPFDIRRYVPGAEADNDIIQAGYDAINRLVLLIGNKPFGALFREERWDTLMPEIAARLTRLSDSDLLRDADAAADCFDRLGRHGDTSWHSYIHEEHAPDVRSSITQTHQELSRQGIFLPSLGRSGMANRRTREALSNLLENAPHLTYRGIFEPGDHSPAVRASVRRAIRGRILFGMSNDRCCSTSGCVALIGGTCYQPQSPYTCDMVSANTACGDPGGDDDDASVTLAR